jgi:hypothetical protein
MNVITKKYPKVWANKDSASFFLPSTYICAGFPINKNPVSEAEKTNKNNKAIGARKAFDLPIFSIEPKYMNVPTKTIYNAVRTELIKAVFLILSTSLLYQINANPNWF